MKKIPFFILLLIFLYSCSPIDSISLSVPSIAIGNEGGTVNIVITSSSEWRVLESCDWCNFSTQSGSAGEQINLIIEQNVSGKSRSMLFTFTCGTATAQLTITQEQKDMIVVNKRAYSIEKDGGFLDFEFKTNSEFTIEIESGIEWISIDQTYPYRNGWVYLRLNILPNESFIKRKGIICLSTSDEKQRINIIQSEVIPYISISNNNSTLSYEGGTVSVEINTNISYNIKMPNVDWICEVYHSNQLCSYVVSPNTGIHKRKAQIIFYNDQYAVADTLNICVRSCGKVGSHEYIDLELPSGTLWARYNVGASLPEEIGDYFAWGETAPKDGYINSTYKYSGYYDCDIIKYYYDEKDYLDNIIPGDGLRTLEPEDDAATVNWGEEWRMPTNEELEELVNFLIDKKVFYKSELNGVGGIIYYDTVNEDFFFLPGGGHKGYNGTEEFGACFYWSSSLGTIDSSYAQGLDSGLGFWPNLKRWAGLLVRPVVNEESHQ